MTKSNTNVSTFTTLSESELFNRFLDAPYRCEGLSALSKATDSEDTMLERYLSYYGFDSVCLAHDLADDITAELRNCDDPRYELNQVIDGLESMAQNLRILRSSFEQLAKETRTPEPGEDATDEEFRMWEENPLYLLAETEMSAV